MTKVCTYCGVSKPLNEFVRDKHIKSGRAAGCLTCANARAKVRSLTIEGQAYIKQYRAEYVVDHKAHYIRNQAQIKATSKKRYLNGSAIIELAKRGPCLDCGRNLSPICMDFDHVRGEKKHNVCRMKNHHPEALIAEIAKCDLVCANCHRVRTEQRRTETKNPYNRAFRDKVRIIKSAPCVDCGSKFPAAAMDFDHVRGVKESCIANLQGSAKGRLEREIAKCDLVCANCHRIRTYKRRLEEPLKREG